MTARELRHGIRSGIACLVLLGAGAQAASPHYVFAHYMVCYAAYGQSIAGYKQEIQDAQAAGIDGFALDVGAWSGSDWYYKTNVSLMYQAAEQLNTGFKLFFSVDMSNTNDIVQMISTYANRTNSFHYHGGLVVSSFGLNWLDWTNGVFKPLRTLGISNIFFVPDFGNPAYSFPDTYAGITALLAEDTYLNGLFDFACGLPSDVNFLNTCYHQACTNAGKLFMAGCSPTYWGCAQITSGRQYIESQGGEGTIAQWNWIIQNQPEWVEIVTWNDLNESTYINPLATPDQFYPSSTKRYCHAGYLEFSKRYITWYKTGQQPPITQDSLFYFYRTHPTNAVASNTNDIPVTIFNGAVQDVIYTTVFLTNSANLEILSGNTQTNYSLPAGISNVRTPFAPGKQTFNLWRGTYREISVHGPDILATITNYDFFPASGFASPLPPPAKLAVTNSPGHLF